MRVLVDSNVILDIVNDDPIWGDWSDGQVTLLQPAGLLINPMIYSELCARSNSTSEVDALMIQLKLEFLELSREALFLAAKAFLIYRQRGGTKTAPLPDFFIGAHAEAMGIPILTRDSARYKTYFPSVRLICP